MVDDDNDESPGIESATGAEGQPDVGRAAKEAVKRTAAPDEAFEDLLGGAERVSEKSPAFAVTPATRPSTTPPRPVPASARPPHRPVAPPAAEDSLRFTGSYLVVFEDSIPAQVQMATLRDAGIAAAPYASTRSGIASSSTATREDVVFERLGVAVVHAEPAQLAHVTRSGVVRSIVGRERIAHATSVTQDYLRGYLDGLNAAVRPLLDRESPLSTSRAASQWDERRTTWGLQATGVDKSRFTGRGIRVAVLDTGISATHPDFVGRVTAAIGIATASPDDVDGHGTHCAGIACGPASPRSGPRFGAACDAELFVAKVLDDAGSGIDRWFLAGLDWALQQRCDIVSMSFGGSVTLGEAHDDAFETVARRLLTRHNMLLIAAAGNRSGRPVDHPANCPSIMAIAALGKDLRRASFSNRGRNSNGGEINVAAPGVDILSTVPPDTYDSMSGTSMATPLVAGCAAMIAEETGLRGLALWREIEKRAKPLTEPVDAVGRGLVSV